MKTVKFQEVNHLYLPVEFSSKSDIEFTGVAFGIYSDKYYCEDEDGNDYYHDTSDAIPHLRPLSSMTEEEAVHVAKLSEWEPHFNDVKVSRNGYDDLIVTWQGGSQIRDSFNSTGEKFYNPDQFLYLLSKSFDLFDLIESGQAIDSTTLPSKQ